MDLFCTFVDFIRHNSIWDSLWTCGNIHASGSTKSCLIICLLNVKTLIQTIYNMYTVSFWKHIFITETSVNKGTACYRWSVSFICFELSPLSQLADPVYPIIPLPPDPMYPIIPLPPGHGVGPPDQCLSLCPTETSPDPDPVKTNTCIEYREILFDYWDLVFTTQQSVSLIPVNSDVTEIRSRISRKRLHEIHKIYFCSGITEFF